LKKRKDPAAQLYPTKNIFVSTADPSGDVQVEPLIKRLKKLDKNIKFMGFGGPLMSAASVSIKWKSVNISSIGIINPLITQITDPILYSKINEFKKILLEENPDILLLISSPGLNLMLAKIAKKRNIPVIYFLPPEIWAWEPAFFGKIRLKRIVKNLSMIISCYQFEAETYKKYCNQLSSKAIVIHAQHPYTLLVHSDIGEKKARNKFLKNPHAKFVIGLMPGSRKLEISRHLTIMINAAKEISKTYKDCEYILPTLTDYRKDVEDVVNNNVDSEEFKINLVEFQNRYDAMKICDIVITSSGFATLELTILEIPSIIIYKISTFEEFLIKKNFIKLKTKCIGWPNILAEKYLEKDMICPELLQKKANATRIKEEAISLLGDENRIIEIKKSLRQIHKMLKNPMALDEVANAILEASQPKDT